MNNRQPACDADREASESQQASGLGIPDSAFIQKLNNDLDALNERIAELKHEGHRGHALDVLKANALDFARQIDELRSILIVVPTKKGRS